MLHMHVRDLVVDASWFHHSGRHRTHANILSHLCLLLFHITNNHGDKIESDRPSGTCKVDIDPIFSSSCCCCVCSDITLAAAAAGAAAALCHRSGSVHVNCSMSADDIMAVVRETLQSRACTIDYEQASELKFALRKSGVFLEMEVCRKMNRNFRAHAPLTLACVRVFVCSFL